MTGYWIAYGICVVWLLFLYANLSDYAWYRALSVGTWGFIVVESLTLLPIVFVLFLAELWRKRSSAKAKKNGAVAKER